MAIKKVKNSRLAKAKAAARKKALSKQRERAEQQSEQDNLSQDIPLPKVTVREWDKESLVAVLHDVIDTASTNPSARVQFTAGAMLRFLVSLGVINQDGQVMLELPLAERIPQVLDPDLRERLVSNAEERKEARRQAREKRRQSK